MNLLWKKLIRLFKNKIALEYKSSQMKEYYQEQVQTVQSNNNLYFFIMSLSYLIPITIYNFIILNYTYGFVLILFLIFQIGIFYIIQKNPKKFEHIMFIWQVIVIVCFLVTMQLKHKQKIMNTEAQFFNGFLLGVFLVVFEVNQTNILYKIITSLIIIVYACFFYDVSTLVQIFAFFQLLILLSLIFLKERNQRIQMIKSFKKTKHCESQKYLIAQDIPSNIVIISPKQLQPNLMCSVQITDILTNTDNPLKYKEQTKTKIEQKEQKQGTVFSAQSFRASYLHHLKKGLEQNTITKQNNSPSQKEMTINSPCHIGSMSNNDKDQMLKNSEQNNQSRYYNLQSQTDTQSRKQDIEYQITFANSNFLNYMSVSQNQGKSTLNDIQIPTNSELQQMQSQIFQSFEKMIVTTNVDKLEDDITTKNGNQQKLSQLSPLRKKVGKKTQIVSMNLNQVINKCVAMIINDSNDVDKSDEGSEFNNCYFQPKLLDSFTNCQHFIADTYFDIKIVRYFWEDQISLMIIIDDISPKVLNYRRQEQELFKEQILSQITHNLKTPLNGIQCSIENLKDVPSTENKSNNDLALSIALKNCKLLSCMIDDIIDYSCLLKEDLIPYPTQFNLRDLMIEIKDLFYDQMFYKQIEFNISYDEILKSITIFNDQRRIVQILVNLLSNSLKYTFSGSIELQINYINDNLIKVSINDTGIGFDSHQKINLHHLPNCSTPKNLFQQQLHTNYKEGNNIYFAQMTNLIIKYIMYQLGIGLGFQMSNNLINQLGPEQTLDINSQINQGTSVQFYLYISLNFKMNDQSNYIRRKEESIVKNRDALQFYNQFDKKFNLKEIIDQKRLIEDQIINSDNLNKNIDHFKKSNENLKKINEDTYRYTENPIILPQEVKKKSESNNKQFDDSKKIVDDSCDRITNVQENVSLSVSEVSRKIPFKVYQSSNIQQFQDNSKAKKYDAIADFLKGMHIMIVDDTIFNILALKIFFQSVPKLQIDTACNGLEAVQKYQNSCQNPEQQPIQLIFMDINMPIMDGEEATRHIKQLSLNYPEISQVKIITVSAFNLESDKERFIQAGSNYHLPKPIEMVSLLKAIQNIQ